MKLDEALEQLIDVGEPPFELNGQCFDVMVQAIEHRRWEFEGKLFNSRRLGDLQIWLEKVEPLPIQLGFKKLRSTGKQAISELYPNQKVAEEFVQATVSWLRMTGWVLPEYTRRTRYCPLEVNSTGFEWGGRYRTFRVLHGSVTRTKSEMLVLSAEIGESGTWSGQAMGAVDLQLGLGPIERRLFHGNGLEVVIRSPIHNEAPFDRVMLMGIPSEWGDLTSQQYAELVRAMLTSLRAEETWNEGIDTVSCSLLGGNRLACSMSEAGALLIESARLWMRHSELGEEFHLVLIDANEAASFSKAMDEALGRVVERIVEHPVAEPLRTQLVEAISQLPSELRRPAEPLVDTLNAAGGLTVELVCTFARSWVEQLAIHLLKEAGVKPSGEFMRSIEKLREHGLVSPWIAGYMHTCRIMGNKAVHPPKSPPSYSPDRLMSTDLVAVMSALHALVVFITAKPQ